jgi:hypothetical protein
MEARRRELEWVERQNFHGWACSECAWEFKSAGPPTGGSLEEMKKHYQQRRDKEFASHVCAENPTPRGEK